MPELPEVETIARDLRASVLGARVTSVWWSGLGLRLGRRVDLAGLRAAAERRVLADVRRKGKYLLLDFSSPGTRATKARARAGRGQDVVRTDAGVLIHLGMAGRLRVQSADAPRANHTHVVFTLSDGRQLRFVDPRRFGWVAVGTPVDARPELAGMGPDPLSELDAGELAARMRGVRAPLKAFLLDQKRIAGLGNIYVCEALHRARLHPSTPAGRAIKRAPELVVAIRAALEQGLANRGTSLRDYVDASGERGENGRELRVYGQTGRPCPVCRTAVRRRVDSGRSTFFCPACQKQR